MRFTDKVVCNKQMIGYKNKTVEVEVRPFKHQVGGHTCVLEVTKSVICKPYVPREVWFYENEPEELKEFTPKYLGETLVTCDIRDEKKCLLALVPESVVSSLATSSAEHSTSSALSREPLKKLRKSRSRPNSDSNESDEQGNLETWSKVCIDRQINRYGFWTNNQPQQFILLENLVHEYEQPCLMDLKMGRRQFGDDSDEQKRKLLQSRCASSTSVTLGFRICGSQTFNVKDKTYVVHDKYVGRNLDVRGAHEELKSFFYNGKVVRKDAINSIVKKLEKLRAILMTQDLRFYSVSLLLLYDGASPECTDCAMCNESLYHKPPSPEKPLDRPFEQRGNVSGSKNTNSETRDLHQSVQQTENVNRLEEAANNLLEERSCNMCNRTDSFDTASAKVDVRMIDFAHVSQAEGSSENSNDFTDETVVFGLNHLQKMLSNILQEASSK